MDTAPQAIDPQALFDDDEIVGRMERIQAAGFRDESCVLFAEELVHYARGDVAQDVIRRLTRRIPSHRLPDLLRTYVIRHARPGIDYAVPERANLLAIHLSERGFEVRPGWQVEWPGHEVLDGPDLPRLALLAVWLRTVRVGG